MRILFLSSVFPRPYAPHRGIYCYHLCSALAAGHEVRVVSPRPWLERLRHGPAPAQNFGGLGAVYPSYYYPPGLLYSAHGWCMWASIRGQVRRLLAEFRPDCVLSYWAYPDGEAAVRAARLAGAPAALMIGGSDVLVLARQAGRRRSIANVLRQADAVITASHDLKGKVLELGAPAGKVHAVYRGVDTERFCPGSRPEARARLGISPDRRVLLWVGRMVPVKGLDVLLEACDRLRPTGLPFRLYLVGDGPLRPALERDSRARGLSGFVTFVGAVAQGQLPDWYRAADVMVLPSRSEGVPNVLRESVACGTRFVASRVGGIPEIADERLDRLVPPEDPDALAGALAQGLQSGGASASLAGRSGDWAESAEALLRVLRPLLAGTPAAEQHEGVLHGSRC